tara:strand:+ start:158 stop:493 length:336 start_codon:yes stop_codon:yes gene_type:complete
MNINYKRNEDVILESIREYVDATYNQHYMGSSNSDVIDDWEDCGIAKEAFQSNIIKYAKRFGKKEGDNPKDIMKIIHYCIFLLNTLDYKATPTLSDGWVDDWADTLEEDNE